MWWEGNEEWFNGDISGYNPETGEHNIKYDDGDDDVRRVPPPARATSAAVALGSPTFTPNARKQTDGSASHCNSLKRKTNHQWANMAEEFEKKTMYFVKPDDPDEEDVPPAPEDALRAEEARTGGAWAHVLALHRLFCARDRFRRGCRAGWRRGFGQHAQTHTTSL